MVKLIVLSCVCMSFALAQSSDTTCSADNQKALRNIHYSAVLDAKFLASLDEGNIRWLNVVVRQCKLDFFKTFMADTPPETAERLRLVSAMMDYDELSNLFLSEKARRNCAAGSPISRFGF